MKWFAIFFSILLIIGCAAVAPPSGGPADDSAPYLVSANPISGTTGIHGGFTVMLTFSERLDEATIEKSIRISPVTDSPYTIDIKKENVIIVFPDSLSDNQTYIVTVSRNLMDEHKNRLDKTYQIAYSTGSEIANGVIRGFVDNSVGKETTVYLYPVNDNSIDSLFMYPPNYYSEPDDSGYFSFSFLEEGNYQILALGGSMGFITELPPRFPYGVHWKAPLRITNTSDTLSNINMRIFLEHPELNMLKSEMQSFHRGYIRFTNPVSLQNQIEMSIKLTTESDESFTPDVIHQINDNSSEIYFHSFNLEPGSKYLVVIEDVIDVYEQILTYAETEIIVPETDTTGITVYYPVKKSVSLFPHESFSIQFSDVITPDTMYVLITTGDTDQVELKASLKWDNPTHLSVQPEEGWQPEHDYAVSIIGSQLNHPGGKVIVDSLIQFNLSINEKAQYGGVSGTVEWDYSENSIVVAEMVENSSNIQSANVNSEDKFEFKLLPSGIWLLSIFQDKNSNGRYDYGSAVPFHPSEPYFDFPDTIDVRGNWDIEGILLKETE